MLSGRSGARPSARRVARRGDRRTVGTVNVTTATQVLGLPPRTPDRDDLVSAWRRFARTHHPDRCPGDPGAAWRFDRVIEPTPASPVAEYGRTGVVRGRDAGRAIPYEMRPLHTREWRA